MRGGRAPKVWPAPSRWYDGGVLAGLRITQLTILVPVFILGLCVAMPVWTWHARRIGRRQKPIETGQEGAMSMSTTLRGYLEAQGRPYEVLHHARAVTSMETAQAAHVPGRRVAKSVLIEDEEGYLIAVIPATHRLLFGVMRERFGHRFGLATEREMKTLFTECEAGSLPPFGQVFGLRVVVDDALLDEDDVYCESGDHTELVHVTGSTFRALMNQAEHGRFSSRV
jgi:Ala-tRNA(Pro) deacylase